MTERTLERSYGLKVGGRDIAPFVLSYDQQGNVELQVPYIDNCDDLAFFHHVCDTAQVFAVEGEKDWATIVVDIKDVVTVNWTEPELGRYNLITGTIAKAEEAWINEHYKLTIL